MKSTSEQHPTVATELEGGGGGGGGDNVSPVKLRHYSSASTRSTDSTSSSSFDDIEQCCAHIQPNELILDQANRNQAIAIEVPASTLRIDLAPFRPATEVHPEPGDIIEFDRTLFSAWAIFVGDGDVVQIVGSHLQEVPDSEKAIVERAPLVLVAGDNTCRVNNKVHRARERNMLPFHNEIVVRKALSKVGSTVPYNMLQCNSEHYVTEWKYGQRWSDQAQVSLNSFKALRRQHTNSLSESHTVFVNTLNDVLNSPSISTTSGSPIASLMSNVTSGSPASGTITTSINRPMSAAITIPNGPKRSDSIGSSNSVSPPTKKTTTTTAVATSGLASSDTVRLSSSFNTASVQTELSLL